MGGNCRGRNWESLLETLPRKGTETEELEKEREKKKWSKMRCTILLLGEKTKLVKICQQLHNLECSIITNYIFVSENGAIL